MFLGCHKANWQTDWYTDGENKTRGSCRLFLKKHLSTKVLFVFALRIEVIRKHNLLLRFSDSILYEVNFDSFLKKKQHIFFLKTFNDFWLVPTRIENLFN